MPLYFYQFLSAFIGHQPAGSGQLQLKKHRKISKKGSAMFSHLGYTRASGTSLGFEILDVECYLIVFSHIPNIFYIQLLRIKFSVKIVGASHANATTVTGIYFSTSKELP